MSRPVLLVGAILGLLQPLLAQQAVDAGTPRDAGAGREATVVGDRDVEVEEAVERGLAWLAERQTENGFWHALVGRKGRGGYVPVTSVEVQERAGTGHLGVTAIAGMAFLAGGHLPGRGKYGRNVQRAVEAVLSCIEENGVITVSGTRMYSHAFAILFLAEVYGESADPKIKDGLERALNIIVDCQNEFGGWRYYAFSRDADLSVTVCQLQALRAARNIGFRIPKTTIDRAVEYVRSSQVKPGDPEFYEYPGHFRYSVRRYAGGRGGRRGNLKLDSYSIQSAAVTALLSAGNYEEELIDPVLDFLEAEVGTLADYRPHDYHFWYGNYYASQVFFHADGLFRQGIFGRYWKFMRRHLLADQERDGRWLNPESQGPGDAFATAVACIVLQIPKQYLPIFQR